MHFFLGALKNNFRIRPDMGLKILGRVGTHFF